MTDCDPLPPGEYAVLLSAAALPGPPSCCEAAEELGYRRGYKDGYTYGFWDAGSKLSTFIYACFWRFRTETLLPWVYRAGGDVPSREHPPRFTPAAQKRHQKGADHACRADPPANPAS